MKQLLTFIKTTLVGGLVVLLPLQLAVMLFGAGLKNVRVLLAPVAVFLPVEAYTSEAQRNIAAVIVLIVLCFVAGLLLRTRLGHSIWSGLNSRIFEKLPLYKMLNRLVRQFTHMEETSSFTPVVIKTPIETQVLALIVDEQPNGNYIVLIPNAPTPLMGELHYVSREQVHKLDMPINKFFQFISEWGVGFGELNTQNSHPTISKKPFT